MHKFILGIALALLLTSVGQAAPLNLMPTQFDLASNGSDVADYLVKVRRGRRCEELRLACKYKGHLGERGRGHCRRYRRSCGRDTGMSYCQRLRWKCMHKEEIGGVGRGYCGRYRRECR